MSAVRLERDYFEDLYAADRDPWRFATSAYERDKYARTVAALEGRRFARGLEVGCSIGVLTERLAGSCDELLAVDVSERAVATARERLAGRHGVEVECRSLPEETPDGPFDLIVCSEVLYYFDAELLSRGDRRARRPARARRAACSPCTGAPRRGPIRSRATRSTSSCGRGPASSSASPRAPSTTSSTAST